MDSRIAPWASPPALARLAAVEGALPADLAAALGAATAAAHAHARRLDEECLQLYAGTNVPSPLVAALHDAALAAQPSMGYPGDKYQAGLEAVDVVEVTAAAAVARVMRASFAEVRPTSATLANLAVYAALARPGDTIAVLPDWAGGHLSHHEVGAPGIRGLRVAPLPYDVGAYDVDVAALDAFVERERPKLVVVGASLMLFPHRLREIAARVDVPILYDASHVAGLIAEGRFQDPLAEGADIMTFSTYKSFGGPPGGAIVTNDAALAEAVATAVFPGLLANYDASRLAPLAAAALERERSAGAYADQCLANARRLAAELDAAGFVVVGAERGFTASHHVALEVRALGGGAATARRLAEANVLLSAVSLPGEEGSGLRIGTQAITRQGFTEADMPDVAAVCAALLLHGAPAERVRADVAALRRRHSGLRWCLTPADLP